VSFNNFGTFVNLNCLICNLSSVDKAPFSDFGPFVDFSVFDDFSAFDEFGAFDDFDVVRFPLGAFDDDLLDLVLNDFPFVSFNNFGTFVNLNCLICNLSSVDKTPYLSRVNGDARVHNPSNTKNFM